MRPPWLAVLLVVLALALPARAIEPSILDAVDTFETEQEECRFLLQLCVNVNRTMKKLLLTPPAADTLVFKQAAELDIRTQQAVQTAEAIRLKRGKKLKCFSDPECAFLADEGVD